MTIRAWNPDNDTLNKLIGALDDIQYLEPSFTTQIDQIHSYLIDLKDSGKNNLNGSLKVTLDPTSYIKMAIEKALFLSLIHI